METETSWSRIGIKLMLVSIGQLALTHAFRTMSVAKGSSMQMLLPLATAAGGYWFLGERYSSFEIAGALVTLFATWQVVRSPSRR